MQSCNCVHSGASHYALPWLTQASSLPRGMLWPHIPTDPPDLVGPQQWGQGASDFPWFLSCSKMLFGALDLGSSTGRLPFMLRKGEVLVTREGVAPECVTQHCCVCWGVWECLCARV